MQIEACPIKKDQPEAGTCGTAHLTDHNVNLLHNQSSPLHGNGGSVVMLQRLLGHSSVVMTMVYVNIQTADLSAAHQRHSLLKG
jgi:site-specific recombinase XerD